MLASNSAAISAAMIQKLRLTGGSGGYFWYGGLVGKCSP